MGSGWITVMEERIVEVNVCLRYGIFQVWITSFSSNTMNCLMIITHESYCKPAIRLPAYSLSESTSKILSS